MASSQNLASIEPWTFRPTSFADSWIPEAFARDTEALTKALQKSISNSFSNSDSLSPLLSSLIDPNPASPAPPTPTASNVSGADSETTAPKRQRTSNSNPPPPTGKVSKRKSRATKRSQTTFITADPANFRQMVQQVTGVKFGNAQMMTLSPILKPEPQRLGSRLPHVAGSGCLPTLDTSAFLLDHQLPSSSAVVGSSLLPSPMMATEGVASAGVDLDSDNLPSFPTLESWKV